MPKTLLIACLQLLLLAIYTYANTNVLTLLLLILYSWLQPRPEFLLSPALRKFSHHNNDNHLQIALVSLTLLCGFGYRLIAWSMHWESLKISQLLGEIAVLVFLTLLHFLRLRLARHETQQQQSQQYSQKLSRRYVVPFVLICISIMANRLDQTSQVFHIILFSVLCFLLRTKRTRLQMIVISLYSLVLSIQTISFYLYSNNLLPGQIQFKMFGKQEPDLLVHLMQLAILVGVSILSSLNSLLEKHSSDMHQLSQEVQVHQNTDQEMVVISRNNSNHALPLQETSSVERIQQLQQSLLESRPVPKNQLQDADESVEAHNLVFLLPFFLSSESLLEIPLYLYIIALQYTTPHVILRYTMYATIHLFFGLHYHNPFLMQLFAVSIVLIMNWEAGVDRYLTNIKALWLRWCFVLVLLVLFWFGLRKVNLFHLALMVILLLFVTKGSEAGQRSFRNRNWKYLLAFMNMFIIGRYIWSMLFLKSKIVGNSQFLELLGLTYDYNQTIEVPGQFQQAGTLNFNFVPMIVLELIVLQYWTYNSVIYKKQSQQVAQIFKVYVQALQQFVKFLTILYYKLVIWGSYFGFILILLGEDFSLTSTFLLICVLVTLVVHILGAQPKFLNTLWLLLSRLVALQILVRYFFEFTKFESVYKIFRRIPFFDTLYKYQYILGLAVDLPSTTYFHTVTKFQLMISLDMTLIMLAYLSLQYLNILIWASNPNFQESISFENSRIQNIYQNYINLQLADLPWVSRLQKWLRRAAHAYVDVFYWLIALYLSFNVSYSMVPYLVLFLIYYEKWNATEYDLLGKRDFMANVKQKFKEWLEGKGARIDWGPLAEYIRQVKYLLEKKKIELHALVRPLAVIATVLNIFLVYASQINYRTQLSDFLEHEKILELKWLFYVNGTSIITGYLTNLMPFILILLLLIIELKCCRYIARQDTLSLRSSQMLPVSGPELSKELIGECSMRVSLLLGFNKLLERVYVMVLIIISTAKNTPYSILYFVVAFFLNANVCSLFTLSRIISIVLAVQYVIMLMNYDNSYLYDNIPTELSGIAHQRNIFNDIFTDQEWKNYWTFGQEKIELVIFALSLSVLASYQFYYWLVKRISKTIIFTLAKQQRRFLTDRLYNMVKSIYRYIIVFSPLYLTLICIGLYMSEFTLTNMLLCSLSAGFLFRQYLVGDPYSIRDQEVDGQPANGFSNRSHTIQTVSFWKLYYRLLQGFVVVFMVIYSVLSIPKFQGYCNPLLCSPGQYKSKVVKAVLVLVFQIGIDILKSKQFSHQMDRFMDKMNKRSQILRIAVSLVQNNKKIALKFIAIKKRNTIKKNLKSALQFLRRFSEDNTLKYEDNNHIEPEKNGILDILLQFLPSFVDPLLLMDTQSAEAYVKEQNLRFLRHFEIPDILISNLDQEYDREFGDFDEQEAIVKKIEQILADTLTESVVPSLMDVPQSNLLNNNEVTQKFRDLTQKVEEQEMPVPKKETEPLAELRSFRSSKSLFEGSAGNVSVAPEEVVRDLLQGALRQSIQIASPNELPSETIEKQKRKFLYLLIIESIISNWQYLTYVFMVTEHLFNNGLITVPLPFCAFLYGLIQQYQASRGIWRFAYLWTVVVVIVKYLFAFGIAEGADSTLIRLIVGNNIHSLFWEMLLLVSLLFQALLLQAQGLYRENLCQVQPMRMALVRHALHCQEDQRQEIYGLLSNTEMSTNFIEHVFGSCQHKGGYDYSVLITTLQITSLVYTFLFYDKMYLEDQVSFDQMIEYNQFSGGMVMWMLVQLVIMLLDRFISILDLREYSQKWDLTLVLKYVLLILVMLVVHYMLMIFVPSRSVSVSGQNIYSYIFYVLYLLYFLVSALQVRDGIDQTSRGFMERYVWYNGYIYMTFRAVPFIFEFKVFSDWLVTKTVMRLFDWIKFQDLFGRLFVAKCNSLFLSGKRMGSKIEWWKKLLMGCPLLLSIVALIFGPLVLFSSLNPLATSNDIVGGSAQLTLRVNHANEYPLFINSHISAINPINDEDFNSAQVQQAVETYNIERSSIQVIDLEEYSDQYWEISEGSERKLLEEPNSSAYELVLTIKFHRKMTSATPIYALNTYMIPEQLVSTFKQTLSAKSSLQIPSFYDWFIRLDNNNGLHVLKSSRRPVQLKAEQGVSVSKKYWVIKQGLSFTIVSDKFSEAIFGYSVVGFYLSIILVVANYFRFMFQGGANLIMLTDIPVADPLLTICEAVYLARIEKDLLTEDQLYWTLIDLVRSPDTLKLISGSYLDARKKTLQGIAPQSSEGGSKPKIE